MKNPELFPLTRNRYFRGKQLVTRDMEAEQRYFNNKRRLINRLLHGCGIVCGLGVTLVEADGGEGLSVAVEPGLAIDGTGREVVVPEQVYLRLSELDGFTDDSGMADRVFLCVEYAETEREPMHSILDSAVASDHYNRVEEGARFYLSYTEPERIEAPAIPAEAEPDAGLLKAAYCDENLEKKLAQTRNTRLCLAAIRLIRWDAAYTLTAVEAAPYRSYVTSASLSAYLCETALNRLKAPALEPDAPRAYLDAEKEEPLLRQGYITVDIPADRGVGTLLYSKSVPHGLGAGPVAMSVAQVFKNGVIYGSRGIFDEPLGYEYALKTNEEEGSFQIGVKITAPKTSGRAFFSWLAVRAPYAYGAIARSPYLLISPGTARLSSRETMRFTCKAYGFDEEAVLWRVAGPGGGAIDADGTYRAPDLPGVYEITAGSVEYPHITGSAYVMVVQ